MIRDMLEVAMNKAETKSDGAVFINKMTGQGGATDPSRYTLTLRGAPIPDSVAAALFNGNAIARKICTRIPQDAIQNSFYINIDDKDISNALIMQCDDLNVVTKYFYASSLAKAFGGAAIIMTIDDGQEPDKPLNMNKIKKIYSLDIMDKRYLMPHEYDYDPYSPTFGEPLSYVVTNITGQRSWNTIVHRSRMIIFMGEMCTDDEMLARNGWGLSVFDLLQNELNDYNSSYHQTGNLMNRANQAVFKVKGLIEQLASINDKTVQRRWDVVDAFRSIYKAIVLDSDTEEFSYESINVSGWDSLILKYQERLAGSAGIPLQLLGIDPSGGIGTLNESALRLYYGEVRSYQQWYMKPKLEQLLKIIASELKIQMPDTWSVGFPNPYTPTTEETTKKRLDYSTMDVNLINAGVYTADEVAVFRSQENGWDKDMTLTEEQIKIREDRMRAEANPPAPEPTEETPPPNTEPSAENTV